MTPRHGARSVEREVVRRDRSVVGVRRLGRSRRGCRTMRDEPTRSSAQDASPRSWIGLPPDLEEHVPVIKPFRALRYEPDEVGDLALVTSPPYDVIGDEQRRSLLAHHPKNIVRLDLPGDELGDEPDDRYRRAAKTFAAWRSDGTFHKDPRPSLYVYEQTYTVPGSDVRRIQRGFFARLRLESAETGGVLPHESTLAAPREDRYKLLRATGANMSPIVGLHEDPDGAVATLLAAVAGGANGGPVADIVDGDETVIGCGSCRSSRPGRRSMAPGAPM